MNYTLYCTCTILWFVAQTSLAAQNPPLLSEPDRTQIILQLSGDNITQDNIVSLTPVAIAKVNDNTLAIIDKKDNTSSVLLVHQAFNETNALTAAPIAGVTYKHPADLVASADGKTLYVVDSLATRIYVLDLADKGKLVHAIETGAAMPLAVDMNHSNGTLWYLTDDGKLHQYNPETKQTKLLMANNQPIVIKGATDFAIDTINDNEDSKDQEPASAVFIQPGQGNVCTLNLTDGSYVAIASNFPELRSVEVDNQHNIIIHDATKRQLVYISDMYTAHHIIYGIRAFTDAAHIDIAAITFDDNTNTLYCVTEEGGILDYEIE